MSPVLISKNYNFAFSEDTSKSIATLNTDQAATINQQNLIRSKLTEIHEDVGKKATADDLDTLSGEVSNKAIELDSLASSVKNMEGMTPVVNDPIFFTATAEGETNPFGTKSAIIMPFKNIKQQMGGGYDAAGTFVAPQGGIFYFAFTLMKYSDGQSYYSSVYADLYHNDLQLCRGYDNDAHSYHHMFGCSATVQMKTGDRVYVQLVRGKLHSGLYCTFTGVRILPIN